MTNINLSLPRVLIPLFPATNCHEELAHAFTLAGAAPEVVPINELLAGHRKLSDTELLAFAGGFSYGDHFRSGAVAAADLINILGYHLREVRTKGIPIIGICNGFQILCETGLLPGEDAADLPGSAIGEVNAVLDRNYSARFEHRANVTVCFKQPDGLGSSEGSALCVWITEVAGECIPLPIAHGEGRLEPPANELYRVVATYGTPEGDADASPNGSPIAGICSADGLVFGMMPHPERRIDKLRGGDQGLAIFRAGVEYAKQK